MSLLQMNKRSSIERDDDLSGAEPPFKRSKLDISSETEKDDEYQLASNNNNLVNTKEGSASVSMKIKTSNTKMYTNFVFIKSKSNDADDDLVIDVVGDDSPTKLAVHNKHFDTKNTLQEGRSSQPDDVKVNGMEINVGESPITQVDVDSFQQVEDTVPLTRNRSHRDQNLECHKNVDKTKIQDGLHNKEKNLKSIHHDKSNNTRNNRRIVTEKVSSLPKNMISLDNYFTRTPNKKSTSIVDQTKLRTVKVVLDKDIVINYLKSVNSERAKKLPLNTIETKNIDSIKTVPQRTNKLKHNNKKLNIKEDQKQRSILNYFNVTNITNRKSTLRSNITDNKDKEECISVTEVESRKKDAAICNEDYIDEEIENEEISNAKSAETKNYRKLVRLYCSKCNIFKKKERKHSRKCEICKTVFKAQCIRCEKICSSYALFWAHINYRCIPNRCMNCNDCSFSTTTKTKLRDHILSKHIEVDQKDYVKCSRCGKGFRLPRYLKYHKTHCNAVSKQCTFCPYKTTHRYYLKKHMESHMLHVKDGEPMHRDNNSFSPYQNNSGIVIPHLPKEKKVDTFLLAENYCEKCNWSAELNNSREPLYCGKCNKKSQFRCKRCSRLYITASGFYYHLREKCFMPKFFECDHCDSKYERKDGLRRHILAKHMEEQVDENGYIPCPKCNRKYKGRANMRKHMSLCKVKLNLKCKFCPNEYKYKNHLRLHMLRIHKNVAQDEIKSYLKLIANIRKRMLKEKEGKNVTTSESKENYMARKPLSRDTASKRLPRDINGIPIITKSMSNEEKKKTNHMVQCYCKKCDQTYKLTDIRVKQTCQKCHSEYRFQCMSCSKDYKSMYKLRCHIKLNHLLDESQRFRHVCSGCGLRYTFFEQLRSHWRICLETKIKNLTCDDCGYSTYRKGSLTKHIIRHHLKGVQIEKSQENQKLYAYRCHECNSCFKSKYQLIKHMQKKTAAIRTR